tara:strand:+ start:6953 stop:7510 length:558 start_codon:yes stop_codon:yes gene_type:complete
VKFFFLFFILIFNISFAAQASIKKEIINNFKKIKNISFNFKQTIGEKTEIGNCIIEYPKKIYCKYDNFKKKIIVSNGKSLVIKNRAINQYFRYPLNKTPLNILLNKDYIIKEMEKIDGKVVNEKYYNFLLKQSENEINIFFDINSYDLIGWQTEDIYQNLVVTYIYNIEKNNVIKKKYFQLPPLN